MKCLAIIPARGGSRRLPRKNILPLAGRPLICHSIATARESALFDEIWVSTEDTEIGRIASDAGARVYVRRAELAGDDVSSEAVARDVLMTVAAKHHNFCCMIYPTAPLMLASDLERGLNHLLAAHDAPYAYSCALKPQRNDGLKWDAGQWYWGRRRAWILGVQIEHPDSIKVVIPVDRVCDINVLADFERAERLYAQLHRETA